jgi:hypothetical protein
MAFVSTLRVIVFGILAWMVPALVAGALGWSSIWGGGSALVDYLIPMPVAGGALHVPSVALLMVLVVHGPRLSAKAAGRARALAVGAMLTGGVLLLPPPDWRLSQNPLGLFLAVDALVALVSLLDAPRQPGLRLEAGALLALLAVPALGAMVAWRALGLGESFVSGRATLSEDRAVVSVHVEARGDIAHAGLRQRAQEWAMTLHDPAMKMGVEVAELRFTGADDAAATAVLCLYEDGRPPRWLTGQGDCLQGYTTFASRLARHAAAVPPDAPREVREFLAARAACAEIGWKSAHAISPMSYSADEACMDLPRRGEFLAKLHPQLR